LNPDKIKSPTPKLNFFAITVSTIVLGGFIGGTIFFINEYRLYTKKHRDFYRNKNVLASLEKITAEQVQLEKRYKEMQRTGKDLDEHVKQMEKRFAPMAPETFEHNKFLVVDLAMRCGFRIVDENMPDRASQPVSPKNSYRNAGHKGPKRRQARETFLDLYPSGDLYKRPVLKFTAETTFSGASIFFEKLQSLNWHVTPIHFSFDRIELKQPPVSRGGQRFTGFGQPVGQKKAFLLHGLPGSLRLNLTLAL